MDVNAERNMYKNNIYFLAKDLLGFNDLTVAFHYRCICKKLNEPRQKDIRLWLVPRGFFKTTILTVSRSIHLQLNNPPIRIAIVSAVMANAKSMVVQIGNTYLTNERFRMLFSEFCPKKPLAPETKWTESEIHIPNRGGRPVMEGTFEAFGADSTLTSRHFDHLIVDDLVTRENCTTRDQMQKIKDFYKAIFPLRNDPRTPIDIVGTRWDDFDLYGDLENDPDVEVIKFASYSTVDGKKIPLWPERYSIDELMKIKSGPKMGSYLFSCLYQQDPIPSEDAVFKPEYFQYFSYNKDKHTVLREDGTEIAVGDCYMAIDGATEEGKNDSSVIIVGFQDHKDNVYILDMLVKQVDPAGFIDLMQEYFTQWKCIKYGAQKAMVEKMLKSFLRKKQISEKFYMPVEELGKNTGLNKEYLIKQMQPWYEGRYVWHNVKFKGGTLEEQLLRFPKAAHDDASDAEQMLFEVLKPSSKKQDEKNYDRNSLEMWKRRLKRALVPQPNGGIYGIVDSRTY
jgi:predicted phage terminase large subunit-like protein